MATMKQITGNTSDEIWQQVSTDLSGGEVYEYSASLLQGGKEVELLIDIDLGGGFESGSAYVSFTAPISAEQEFRFALHHRDWIDTAGKFFGMEDVEIGYPEFDDAMIIKTDDRDKTRRIFADAKVREALLSLQLFTLHLTHGHLAGQKEKLPLLELGIEEDINDPAALRKLYEAFLEILNGIAAA